MADYKLITGDSAEVLAGMTAGSVDLVITSPPYDNLRDYHGYAFDFHTIAKGLARVLADGGVIMWNVADATIDGSETGTSFRQALHFKDECGLRLHDTMIWQKMSPTFPPRIEDGRYAQMFEYVFILSKGKPKTINLLVDKPNKAAGEVYKETRVTGEDGKPKKWGEGVVKKIAEFGIRWNVWVIPGDGKTDHPATMPLALAADMIKTWSNEGDLVLDPFSGSGTTGVAARQLGRRYIGIDVSAEYNAMAERRIEKEVGGLL